MKYLDPMKLFSFKTIASGYVFYSIIYFTVVAFFYTLSQRSSSLFEWLALNACTQLNIICLCCIFWVLMFISSIVGMALHYSRNGKVQFTAFHTIFILSGLVLMTLVF